MMMLHEGTRNRDNNFNLLRMVAAGAVLVSHAYPIALGTGASEPLYPLLKINLGTLAVLTFFVISGFFISQSFERRSSIRGFVAARVLRLYPGLFVALGVTVLVVGPLVTTLPLTQYFGSIKTLAYVPSNISLKWLQYGLPGVFLHNPYPEAINGSLWSLFYEVVCYAAVLTLGVAGVTARARWFLSFLAGYAIIYLAVDRGALHGDVLAANFHDLTFPFVVGMAFYRFRRFVPLHVGIAALSGFAAVMSFGTPWFHDVFVLFWCYVVFYAGCVPFWWLKAYNRIGDYSYGTYIYAFPCEQIAVALWKGISPFGVIALALPATLLCAVLSWHLLERRALAYRPAVEEWLLRAVQWRRWA